jgi:putative endonuclease
MAQKEQAGKHGEALAAAYLQQQGYQELARNFRYKRAEIDLIVTRDNWLVFVEVKARTTLTYGYPESFVDARKATLLMQAAEAFIYACNWQGHVRFDVISVDLKTGQVAHFEDAIS